MCVCVRGVSSRPQHAHVYVHVSQPPCERSVRHDSPPLLRKRQYHSDLCQTSDYCDKVTCMIKLTVQRVPFILSNMDVNKHLADALGTKVVHSYLAHAHDTPATAVVRVAVVEFPPTTPSKDVVDLHGVPVVVWSFEHECLCYPISRGHVGHVHLNPPHLSPGAVATLRRVLTPAVVQQLFRCHSNVAFVMAAACGEGWQDPAVAIGVSAKGFVPHGEEPFPRHLPVPATDATSDTTVPVFVVDGIAEPCSGTISLARGEAVSNRDAESYGTLGGVVHLADGSERLVTAAHVVCDLETKDSTLAGGAAIRDADGVSPLPVMDKDGDAQARLDDGRMAYKRADGAVGVAPPKVPTVDCRTCVSPVLANLQFHHILTNSWFRCGQCLLDFRHRDRFARMPWGEFFNTFQKEFRYTAPNAALSALLDGTSTPEHRAVCDVALEANEVVWDAAVPDTAGDPTANDGMPVLVDVALLRPRSTIRWNPHAGRMSTPENMDFRRAPFVDGHIPWSRLTQLEGKMGVRFVGASSGGSDTGATVCPSLGTLPASTSDLLFVQPPWMPRHADSTPCKALCVFPKRYADSAVAGDSGALAYGWVPGSESHGEGWQCLGVVSMRIGARTEAKVGWPTFGVHATVVSPACAWVPALAARLGQEVEIRLPNVVVDIGEGAATTSARSTAGPRSGAGGAGSGARACTGADAVAAGAAGLCAGTGAGTGAAGTGAGVGAGAGAGAGASAGASSS